MEHTEIKVPKTLYNRIKMLAEKLGMDVNALTVTLLRECASKVEEELAAVELSEEEKKEIVERLRKLGYL